MMDGKDLYMLACRFPKEVIPNGLRATVPRVSHDEKLGWVGEYWYYIPGNAIPRMYVKLHLPDGLVLEIKKLTDEWNFPCAIPNRELTHVQMEYLEQCVQVIESPEAAAKERSWLIPQWMETHRGAERIWFQLQMMTPPKEMEQGTPPPQWLVKYWTAERVRSTLLSESDPQTEKLLPTEEGQRLWHLAKELPAAKACIPGELEPGLPRLSWSMEYGWIAEYWYYYANAGLGFLMFTEPKYYLKVCLPTGQVLEVKNLTNELRFRQSWLDVWAVWMYKKELDYLARCERLMQKANPTEDEIAQLQGQWLEAHPKDHAIWLANRSQLGEAAVRWILSADRVPNRDILMPLWFGEMVKGVRLGTPDIAAHCVNILAEFERRPEL